MSGTDRSVDVLLQEGVAHHRAGRLVEAESCYREVLALAPGHVDAIQNLGVVAYQTGRFELAIERITRAIAISEAHPDFHWNLGLACQELRRTEEMIAAFSRSVSLQPTAQRLTVLANELLNADRHEAALPHYEQARLMAPDDVRLLTGFGACLQRAGRLRESKEVLKRGLALEPRNPHLLSNLGATLYALGSRVEAVARFREALAISPDHAQAHSNLGELLRQLDRADEALPHCRRAVDIDPHSAFARDNLANALRELGLVDEAEAACREAIRLSPGYAKAYNHLGSIFVKRALPDEAEAAYREAIRLKPDYAEAIRNVGIVLTDSGRTREAEMCYREALRLDPGSVEAHSNLIFMLDCQAGVGPELQQAERRRWYEEHGRGFAAAIRPHDNTPDAKRRLRIGYVSGDFKRHSAMNAIRPVLRQHDHSQVEVFCYSNLPTSQEDHVTRDLRTASDHWHRVVGLDDDELAARIREDRIDILVDLSGHTSGNRLLVFARKPAPVQITAWGHATGTGMATMDYLFADPVAVPAAIRPLFAERIVDLPCILAYEAPTDAPAVTPSPPVQTGLPITFGSFNRLVKLSDATLDLWARLLRAVPASRLLIKDLNLGESSVQRRLRERFEAQGVEGKRLIMLGRTPQREHLATYSRVDIALDPFPQNGGISTLDALHMGVPVVALRGTTVASRLNASILTAVGMAEWVARDEEDYLAVAARWARNPAGLGRLRRKIRPRLARWPLGDHQQYTRAVEQAYRQIWLQWCRQPR
jgi:predicted O-linked N-acetylglucosamine transferase (SPINDLY family)